jgi:hypothetical protein
MIVTSPSGSEMESKLAADVLGSLTYKTPQCGTALSDRPGPWSFSLAFDGYFDHSFMRRPDLSSERWPLPLDSALHSTTLPAPLVAEWLMRRFQQEPRTGLPE